MKKNHLLLCALLSVLFCFVACQQTPDTKQLAAKLTTEENPGPDHAAVKAAILDYVEGIYLVDSTRIERSVDPTLRKIGYWYDAKKQKYYDNLEMTFEQLRSLSAQWNKKGNRANEKSPKVIEIYDVNDKSASAKLTAEWGIDYFHLGKVDGQWHIMNVLWQSIREE